MESQESKSGLGLWESAEKAYHENGEKLSSRIFTLSAGGLGLSFTIFSFIVGENKSVLGWPALAIWGAYLLCILLDTFALAYAKRLAGKLEKRTREMIEAGETITDKDANTLVDQLNRRLTCYSNAVFILVIVTLVCTAAYCYWLILSA